MTKRHLAWTAVHEGERVELKLTERGLYFEIGSDKNASKRGHEGHGGTLSVQEFRDRPELFGEFEGLYERVLADLDEEA